MCTMPFTQDRPLAVVLQQQQQAQCNEKRFVSWCECAGTQTAYTLLSPPWFLQPPFEYVKCLKTDSSWYSIMPGRAACVHMCEVAT